MAESHGEFDLVAFEGDDAAFVIAVARGPRAADDLVAVGLEARGELVHGLRAAKAEGDVRVAGAREGLRRSSMPGRVMISRRVPLPSKLRKYERKSVTGLW